MRKNCKSLKKLLILVVLFAVVFCLNAAVVEAGDCEEAFMRCVEDPFVSAFLGGGMFCIIGYVFCKKYIER